MIFVRCLSAALATLSLFLGAPPAHAYATPDEFIQGGGATAPAEDVGDVGNVPLPKLGTPPSDPMKNIPLPQLSAPPGENLRPKVNVPLRKIEVPVAPVLQENQKQEEQNQPVWQSKEEERSALRNAHSAAPEIPHTAATPLASSGLPLAIPLLMSAFTAVSMRFLRKKNVPRN